MLLLKKNLGYFYKKICHERPIKIAQIGHTAIHSVLKSRKDIGTKGSGCDSVGGAVAPISEVRGLNPVISKNLYWTLVTVNYILKTKIKEKETGNSPFFKKVLELHINRFLLKNFNFMLDIYPFDGNAWCPLSLVSLSLSLSLSLTHTHTHKLSLSIHRIPNSEWMNLKHGNAGLS